MQKFDWNTFNATHDHEGGPISRYVHDGSDLLEYGDRSQSPYSGLGKAIGIALLGVVGGLILAIDHLVF
ncbi:hypothetical protein KRZ98_17130 [Sphingobium sp. AS12]|uniref:hypothetical protein n=1 Tax=Sphingobium sp. AS12 TaxID=2849495 RepID=UPI001C318037|nr:hypothetical protein [Sphingobium sp. AS12]MBV2149969.1 hypothetical protein [Sphingobium sp. AS12]